MNTLIKWPGGKSREFHYIESLIPQYKRYIEPFFGGGAVFFNLEPENAIVNDFSEDLMNFYSQVQLKSKDFVDTLEQYAQVFDGCLQSGRDYFSELYEIFKIYDDARLKKITDDISLQIIAKNPIVKEDFSSILFKYVKDKMQRTIKNNEKHPFSKEDLSENLATGFSSAVYMYFRGIHNKMRKKSDAFSQSERAANFYFIREYCYGSMFRYNSNGDFNIPYGGVSYNKKNFHKKITYLLSSPVSNLFANCKFCNLDFEDFFRKNDFSEDDFIFLDPPYDTEFSDYDGNCFGKADQERLRNVLIKTKAKFILIIKNTDFIYSLYKDNFKISTFDKTYSYNVKSRNDRDVEHLIITNY